MAVTFIADGGYANGNPSVTLAYPAGIVAGNLLLAFVSVQDIASGVNTPGGWTLIGSAAQCNNSGTYNQLWAFYQVYSTGTSQLFVSTASQQIEGNIRGYSGTSLSSPINSYAGSTATTASTTNVVPAITETYNSGELTVYASIDQNNTAPTSYTHTLSNTYYNGGTANSYEIGEYNWGTAPSAFTFTYGNNCNGAIGVTIVPPAVASGIAVWPYGM